MSIDGASTTDADGVTVSQNYESSDEKKVKSVIYPGVSLARCIDSAAKLEQKWGMARVPRLDAAKTLGYSTLSGTATRMLAAMSSFGLVESGGRGFTKVTQLARLILHPADPSEKITALAEACFRPDLFETIRERFDGVAVPPRDGIANYLRQENYQDRYVGNAAGFYLQAVEYLTDRGWAGDASAGPEADKKNPAEQDADETSRQEGGGSAKKLAIVLEGLGGMTVALEFETDASGILDKQRQQALRTFLDSNLTMLESVDEKHAL